MGQYWIIANLDKREFISPDDCNDGAKLMELHDVLRATYLALTPIRALAVLTNTGSNGDGGGDLSLPYQGAANVPDGMPYRLALKLGLIQDRTPSPLFDICGSWCGDRIVAVGEYGNDLQLLPKELHAQAWAERTQQWQARLREEATRDGKPKPFRQQDVPMPNLYFWAHRHFTDITDKIMAVFTACGEGPYAPKPPAHWMDEIEELASRYLWNDFIGPSLQTYRWACEKYSRERERAKELGKPFKKPSPKLVYDLTWLPIELLDSLMRRACESSERLGSLKKFLRSHRISKLVSDLLPHYKTNRADGTERHNFKKIQSILEHAGHNGSGARRRDKTLLPDPEMLQAVRAVSLHQPTELLELLRFVGSNRQLLREQAAAWALGDSQLVAALRGLPGEFMRDFLKALHRLRDTSPHTAPMVDIIRLWLMEQSGPPSTERERVISLDTVGT